MNLISILKSYDPQDKDKPTWKYISQIYPNSGVALFTDGTIGKFISPTYFQGGDRVLVYRGDIMHLKWEDAKYVPPAVVTISAGIYLICIHGTTTSFYDDRLYYLLVGNTLKETSKPAITDDGKYGIVFDIPRDDPDDYLYEVIGDKGIGIAAVANGIAAKDSTQSRYILNGAMEDEIWKAWEWTAQYGAHLYDYDFLQLEDSLILNPLKVKSKPFVSRYVDDGIITIHQRWGESVNNVLNLDSYLSDNFNDSLPMVKRIYHKTFKGDRTYKAIEGDGASASACNFYSDKRKTQDIVRADTFDWYTSKMAEPLQHELYDFDNPYEEKEKLYRSPYPAGSYCTGIDNDYKKVYWIDGDTISCKTLNPTTHKITRSGLDTISNDIKKSFTIDENGKLTYIRFQKDTELTQSKTGVYLADELVEESGWENVEKLYGDTETTISEYNGCPIYVRKTAYQILHAHQEQKFKAIVYRKTFYQSHSSELLDYKIYRSWIGDFVQVRKSAFVSKTTFHIAVKIANGFKIINLPYKCDTTEYQLTGLATAYTGGAIPTVAHLSKYTWCDVANNDNINLTRIFTSEITGKLLIGFDIFPAEWNHNIVREEIGTSGEYALVGKYDDSEYPFPPASDGKYEDVKDRKWLLFNSAGDYTELTPPDVNRINGLCLIEKS